jgi:hypothetical protein
MSLKWRSASEEALVKKARGLTSLWGAATQQIPAGDMGIVCMAYTEGGRSDLADARTRQILESSPDWWHNWGPIIPLIVVHRLYPRALGDGRPDLIENSLVLLSRDADEEVARTYGTNVFTRPS